MGWGRSGNCSPTVALVVT